jgi:DNA repair exonuclease SbcCD ATPase subunit
MARRVIESVVVDGFGSYGVEQALRLDGRGPVAMVGDNGAGKSTIASKALVWCLFGKAAPERMGTATAALKGKAVVTDGKKTARVTVRVRDVSGEVWTIERTRARTGGDKVVVTSSANGSLTEDDIVAIVGATYEVFTKTVVRGQGDVWAFAEATDARKREILDEVSGAIALEPYFVKAKLVRDEARAQVTTLDMQANAVRARLAGSAARVVALERQRDDWARARAVDLDTRRATVLALEAAEATAAAQDARAADLERQRTALEAARPTLDWGPYREAERRESEALAHARAARAAAEARFLAVRDLAPGCVCPTCAQVIAPTAPVAVQRAAAEPPYVAACSAEKDAQARAQAAQDATKGAQTWKAARDSEHAQAVAQLGARVLTGQLAAAQAATRGAREALATAEKSDNPYLSGVREAVLDEARLERDLAVLEEAALLARERVRFAEASMEALAPKGARASLAESTLAAIETEANRWLDSLSQGTMALLFRRADNAERIETAIRVRARDTGEWVERDLLNFSGGERTRINMACDLGVAAAFDAAGTAVSLLVLDEAVFSGLDSAGQAAIVTLLHGAGVADVVVVDHNERLSSALPRCYTATIGPDGYTRLQEKTA